MEHKYLHDEEPEYYEEETKQYPENKKQIQADNKINPLQARRQNRDYKINPNAIPRPNTNDDIYNNSDKTHYFQTEDYVKNMVPFSNSYFIVNETENSSLRFIRPSINRIPTTMGDINNSGLIYGLYIQPFALQEQGEFVIPSVEGILYLI